MYTHTGNIGALCDLFFERGKGGEGACLRAHVHAYVHACMHACMHVVCAQMMLGGGVQPAGDGRLHVCMRVSVCEHRACGGAWRQCCGVLAVLCMDRPTPCSTC